MDAGGVEDVEDGCMRACVWHAVCVGALQPISWAECVGNMRESKDSKDSPRSQHEFATKLHRISTSLPDRHSHPQRVAHDHCDTADEPVPNVLPTVRFGPTIVCPARHPKGAMYTSGGIGEHLEGCTEDFLRSMSAN